MLHTIDLNVVFLKGWAEFQIVAWESRSKADISAWEYFS